MTAKPKLSVFATLNLLIVITLIVNLLLWSLFTKRPDQVPFGLLLVFFILAWFCFCTAPALSVCGIILLVAGSVGRTPFILKLNALLPIVAAAVLGLKSATIFIDSKVFFSEVFLYLIILLELLLLVLAIATTVAHLISVHRKNHSELLT